jgi:hypothetical protein
MLSTDGRGLMRRRFPGDSPDESADPFNATEGIEQEEGLQPTGQPIGPDMWNRFTGMAGISRDCPVAADFEAAEIKGTT